MVRGVWHRHRGVAVIKAILGENNDGRYQSNVVMGISVYRGDNNNQAIACDRRRVVVTNSVT